MIHQRREFHYAWRSAVLADGMSTTKINGLEFQNNFCKCTSSSNTTAHVAKLCINALRGDVLIFTLSCKTSIDALGGRLRTVILWLFCRGKMNIFVVMSEFYYYAWRFQGWMGGLGRKHQFDVLRGNLNMDVALTEKFASGKPAQRTMRLFLPTWIFIVKVKNRYATRTCICAYAKELSSEKMLGKLIDISPL